MPRPSDVLRIKCPASGRDEGMVTSFDDGSLLLYVRGMAISIEDKPTVEKLIKALEDARDRY